MTDQQTKRVELGGKVYEVPADASLDEIDAVISSQKPIASGEAKIPTKTTSDVGIGAAKGLGRNLLDLSSLVAKINPVDAVANLVLPESVSRNMPGRTLGRVAAAHGDMFDPTNAAQSAGAFGVDLLAAALPAGAAARGGNTLKNMAARQWQIAAQRPIREPLSVARGVLDAGMGRLTRDNAIEYARRFPNLPPSVLQSIDQGVRGAERAALNPSRSVVGLLTSPSVRAAAAQGVNTAAPALSAVAGGGGALALQAMLRLLGGQ